MLVGRTRGELGGSHLLRACGLETGNDVPPVDPAANRRTMLALQKVISDGLVRSCHDLSEGGLAVAAAEMAFAGGLGVEVSLENIPTDGEVPPAAKLFGESAGRFLVEVEPDKADAFVAALGETALAEIGKITDAGRVVVGETIDLPIDEAKQAWQGTFDW
jgi:phosphoribosylformylglycinamidine synthase